MLKLRRGEKNSKEEQKEDKINTTIESKQRQRTAKRFWTDIKSNKKIINNKKIIKEKNRENITEQHNESQHITKRV